MVIFCRAVAKAKLSKMQYRAKNVQAIVKKYAWARYPPFRTGYYMEGKVCNDGAAKTMLPMTTSNKRNVYGDNDGESSVRCLDERIGGRQKNNSKKFRRCLFSKS